MQSLKEKIHSRKGFTLIELIIVIVIIAILAAIAIPAVSKYVGKAKESRDAGNYAVVKTAAGAAAAYATTSGSLNPGVFVLELETILPESKCVITTTPWAIELGDVVYKVEVKDSGAVTITSGAIK